MDPTANDDDERGRVVEAFLEACPDPKIKDVETWCRDHPRHREAIIETATGLIEIALLADRARAMEGSPGAAPKSRDAMRRPAGRIKRLRDRGSDREAD